jgi:hypothetical protein
MEDTPRQIPVGVVPTRRTLVQDRVVVDDERVGATAADELRLRLGDYHLLAAPGADCSGAERLAGEKVGRRRVEVLRRRRGGKDSRRKREGADRARGERPRGEAEHGGSFHGGSAQPRATRLCALHLYRYLGLGASCDQDQIRTVVLSAGRSPCSAATSPTPAAPRLQGRPHDVRSSPAG